jgi:hypothetical protein
MSSSLSTACGVRVPGVSIDGAATRHGAQMAWKRTKSVASCSREQTSASSSGETEAHGRRGRRGDSHLLDDLTWPWCPARLWAQGQAWRLPAPGRFDLSGTSCLLLLCLVHSVFWPTPLTWLPPPLDGAELLAAARAMAQSGSVMKICKKGPAALLGRVGWSGDAVELGVGVSVQESRKLEERRRALSKSTATYGSTRRESDRVFRLCTHAIFNAWFRWESASPFSILSSLAFSENRLFLVRN